MIGIIEKSMVNLQQDKVEKSILIFYFMWLSKIVPFELYVTFENSNNKLASGVFSQVLSVPTSTFSPHSIHICLFISDNTGNQASTILLSPFIVIEFSRNHVDMDYTNDAVHQHSVAGKCLLMRFQY